MRRGAFAGPHGRKLLSRKIIIDADPGIGDSLAILTALRDPNLDVVALTATSGCVSALQATRNLQTLVENADPEKWPRLGAAVEGNNPPSEGKPFRHF